MRFSRPSHATVVAYFALIVALGGSAYAVSKIGSRDVIDNTLRSRDLRDDGVTRRDVRDNTLAGKDIKERGLDATGIATVAYGAGGCDPSSTSFVVCAQATIDLAQASKVFLLGSAGFVSEGPTARSTCEVRFDGMSVGVGGPGEVADNTDGGASDGFTVTGLTTVAGKGRHTVTLECNQVSGDARISTPSIAAIGLGASRIE